MVAIPLTTWLLHTQPRRLTTWNAATARGYAGPKAAKDGIDPPWWGPAG
jgi:hypothetical protein